MRQILSEAIVTKPKTAFCSSVARTLKAYADQVEQAYEALKRLESKGEGEYLLRYALDQASEGGRPLLPSAYSVDLNRRYHLRDLAHNLEHYTRYGGDVLRYAESTLGYVEPVHDEARHVLSLLPHVEAGIADYGYEPGGEDQEYRDAMAMADAYRVIARILAKVEPLYAKLSMMFDDLKLRYNFTLDPHNYKPKHEPVERLYHASLWAEEIVHHGFAAERPSDRRGLGYIGGPGDQISFTHSFKVAQDILRMMRELWMIVHGQITRRTLLGWMEAEGLDIQTIEKLVASSISDPAARVAELYRVYLWFTKSRTNPNPVSTTDIVPALRDRPYKSIGIVSCDVALDDEATYHDGEAEFRVSAAKVVGNIKRVV